MTTMNDTPVGRVEIAKLLDVDDRTPHAWMARGLLPRPDFEKVNGSPAWRRSTIVAWAVHTRRLPAELIEEAASLGYEAAVGTGPQRGGKLAKQAHGFEASA